MKSQEKMKERIEFFMSFFSEVSNRINAGVIEPEELFAIAKKYELPQELFNSLIEAGHLYAFDVSIPFFPPVAVGSLVPNTPHILAWKKQPDELLAFDFHVAETVAGKVADFMEYLLKQIVSDETANCKHCGNSFPSDKGIEGYCCDSCRALASDKNCRVKVQGTPKKDAWDRLIDAAVDLIHEFIPKKKDGHETK